MTIEFAGRTARALLPRLSAALLLLPFFTGYNTVHATAFSAPPQSAQAKQDYALIYGTVWGPDDRRVAGVPLKIRKASDKKPKWKLISDNSGEFAQRVPVGRQDYVIQADIKVLKGQAKPEITVHIDQDERKDVGLHLTQQQLPRK